jgi:hypothetical protein
MLHERLDALVAGSSPETIDTVYLEIVIRLACLLHNNPNRDIREGVRVQLLHPIYRAAKYRFGEELDQLDRRPIEEMEANPWPLPLRGSRS